MYCPWCGSHNPEAGKFCRSCGRELATVAKAMTGEIVEVEERYGRRRHRQFQSRDARLQSAIVKSFMGAGFFLAAIILILTRQPWGVWMLIPAFIMGGRGVAEMLALKSFPARNTLEQPPARRTGEIAQPRTGDVLPPPPSVTEGTTRMMDAEKQPRSENA
jgi:hypothetical protein